MRLTNYVFTDKKKVQMGKQEKFNSSNQVKNELEDLKQEVIESMKQRAQHDFILRPEGGKRHQIYLKKHQELTFVKFDMLDCTNPFVLNISYKKAEAHGVQHTIHIFTSLTE